LIRGSRLKEKKGILVMMNKEQVDLLGEYIKMGEFAILIEEIPEIVIEKGAVVINSDCSNLELMGHYENLEYVAPKWYDELNESAKSHTPVLIIKDINKVPEKEQRKFIELLKHKKIYVNKIPEDCRIFVTYSNSNENPIEEELYSFMVQI
jgi:hypothetical protein